MGVMRTPSLLIALALGACTSPRTELIIVTDTDLAIPTEIDGMRVEVTGPGGEIETAVARFTAGDPPPPRFVGLVPQAERLGPYTIRARATLGGGTVVERVAVVELQPERTLVLYLDLLRSCTTQDCSTGMTCAAGGCRSTTIAPTELTEWNGQIMGRDASIPREDAGMPGDDAGPMDAGGEEDAGGAIDAGDVDAGGCVPETEVCNGMDDDCDTIVDECDLANATASCSGGSCAIDSCDTNFDDCDTNDANGCETDLDTDDMNCGLCDMRCSGSTRDCVGGTCM
jgi:hypothetical protein